MMWKKLKQILLQEQNKRKVSHYLSVAKRFGQFGIGTGGQMAQYLLLSIFKLDKQDNIFYFACGNDTIKQKIHRDFPYFPIESDIISITININYHGYVPIKSYNGSLEAFYAAEKQNMVSINGLSIKTSNKLSKRDCKTLQVGNIKAYCAGSSYSKYTFGPMVKSFMQSVSLYAKVNKLCDDLDQRFFLQYFRHPSLSNYRDYFISNVRRQIRQRISVNPVKIQFSDQQAILFQVPIKDIRQTITINSIMFALDEPIQQGKFYILNKQGRKVLSVYGDRIMICQGLDKETIEKDAVHVPLKNINQVMFLSRFNQFINGLDAA